MIPSILSGAPGSVHPLRRRLDAFPDPPLLFARLTDGGTRTDTILLESAEPGLSPGQKSVLVTRSALRITCVGRTVTVQALTPNGRSVLPHIARSLQATRDGDVITVAYPAPSRAPDEEERRKAPHVLDALRVIHRCLTVASAGDRADGVYLAGIFAYDLVDSVEVLPAAAHDPLGFPDYVFQLAETLVVIDHLTRQVRITCNVFSGDHAEPCFHAATEEIARIAELCGRPELATTYVLDESPVPPEPVEVDRSDAEFAAEVQTLKQNIVAGDVFQIVASRTFRAPCPDPLAAYRALRAINPSPYLFYVRAGRYTLFGASPESSVKVAGASRSIEISPIAGTRPRGRTIDGAVDLDLDARLEAELRLDEKEIAEHMMLVDLARNDVARVSISGVRSVTSLLRVVRYSHVMHLVSTVTGTLRPEVDALAAYQACLNMGTLTGAPKIRAMQLLRERELTKRATYGGAVGYLAGDGSFDTAIIIRAALVVDGIAYVRAGAGVVHDSDPVAETEETRRKAQAVLNALARSRTRPTEAASSRVAPPALESAGKVVLIDNFDSFTFNLVDELRRLRYDVTVLRNDVAPEEALRRAHEGILVLSPGPGAPRDAGCCIPLIRMALGKVPLFGICLGHQALVEALGGEVAGAGIIVHGKKANVRHDERGAFAGLPNPLPVGRYHSLVARRLPDELERCAEVDGLVMAVRHRHHAAIGLQFHPESVLTTHGSRLLANVLAELRATQAASR